MDNSQEYLTMKLISATSNHKIESSNLDDSIPILIYKNTSRGIPLNNWEKLDYFICFFYLLFTFEIGGNISTISSSRQK